MKFPLTWHKEGLANSRLYYERLREQIRRLEYEYEKGQRALNEYDAQIIEAETRGVAEFDREKFGKRRDAADDERKEK